MKPEIKALWVAALRSGEYKQGRGRLRDEETNKFCCLGVLCNLHAQAHLGIAAEQPSRRKYLGRFSNLPYAVMKWAGLSSDLGDLVEIKGKVGSLAFHNDAGHTFKEIAEAIEEQL